MRKSRLYTRKPLVFSLMALLLLMAQLTLIPLAASAATNLAAGKATTESGHADVYGSGNVTDGNQGTYWESVNNAFPQWVRVDLGGTNTVNQVVLKLPAGWGSRNQTLSVQGSTNDSSYTTLAASQTYTFDGSGNTVTINFASASVRYVKINITANTGWPAGQISELEVYNTSTSTPTPTPTSTPTPTLTPTPTSTPTPTPTPTSTPSGGTYQAESAALSGGAKVNTDHAGYTGSGFVDGYWTQGAATTFTVNAAVAGPYGLALRYANSMGSAKTLSLYVNGVKAKQTTLANLANWDTWSTVTDTVSLTAGSNTIKYQYDTTDSGNVNLDSLQLTFTDATPTPPLSPTPTPTATPTATPTPTPSGAMIPGKIEAESYAAMSGIQTEATTDTGGGLNVGWTDTGDWLDYNVYVSSAGTYPVAFRVASTTATSQFQLRNNAGNVLATVNVPNTGGWQSWTTVNAAVSLPAGNQTLRLYVSGTGFNINWLNFATASTPTPTPTATPPGALDPLNAAPYVMPDSNVNLGTVMDATDAKAFTIAFILANGNACSAAWNGWSPINSDTTNLAAINLIRSKGGDVVVSFGGAAGTKLGQVCGDAQSTANAYQQVIDKYNLKAVDFDIETEEITNSAALTRELQAAKILQQNAANASKPLNVSVTLPAGWSGLENSGKTVVQTAINIGFKPTSWTIMPFDFGGGASGMGQTTINIAEAFHQQLKTLYPGLTDAQIYDMSGLSLMNGRTDVGEYVYVSDFQAIANYGKSKGLKRLTYWVVNRDRECSPIVDPGTTENGCSSVPQQPWEFTKIIAQYTAGSSTPPASSQDTWHLVWNDEFSGNSGAAPDQSKWGYDLGGGGWGNNEKEYYTNSTNNAYLDGSGHLVIKAIKENIGGLPYSSARLVSRTKGDWTYGKFEVRAKLPAGKGMWPAIWMLPTDWAYGSWPTSGEIDIMEQRGSAPLTVMGTIHFGTPWTYIGGDYTLPDAGYHIYGMEWDPSQIRWYVDGNLYQTRNASEWFSSGGPSPAPFDKRFHFLLNLAVGGNFDGDPDGSTVFPQSMMVDYVRVYDHSNTITLPARIEAEGYSAMSGIQMENATDAGGGQDVGWIDAGDWMDYNVNVPVSGTYTVQYRVASTGTTGQIQLRSGSTVYATTSVPNTGGWQNWQTVSTSVNLTAGQKTLRVYASGTGFNLNWLNISQ